MKAVSGRANLALSLPLRFARERLRCSSAAPLLSGLRETVPVLLRQSGRYALARNSVSMIGACN